MRIALLALLIFVSGCATQTENIPNTAYRAKHTDVFLGWAITGCVSNLENGGTSTPNRALAVEICQLMTEGYVERVCNFSVPVRQAWKLNAKLP